MNILSLSEQEFFIFAFDAPLAGWLVLYEWNQAWHSSEVYKCIERMIIWKKNGDRTSSLRKPIGVTPRKIYNTKGVITRMKA